MKKLKYLTFPFIMYFLLNVGCKSGPADLVETATCEFDYENNYNALDYNIGQGDNKQYIVYELSQIFSNTESTYLSNWSWERDDGLDISYIVAGGVIVDHTPTLEAFAQDERDEDVDFHVFSVGTKPYVDNASVSGVTSIVGGISNYKLDSEKDKRYAFIFMNDILTRFVPPGSGSNLVQERFSWIRHVFGHELGHQLAHLTHTYGVPPSGDPTKHFGNDLIKCLMSTGVYYNKIPPIVRNSQYCKDPDQLSDCCVKFIKEKLDQ